MAPRAVRKNAGKPMQDVHFRSVEEMFEFIPADERALVEVLRVLVLRTIPDVEERLSYNVPFYKRRKNVCFLWPASVLWGKRKTYDGVRFGFSQGFRLTDPEGYLSRDKRKQVYWRDFTALQEEDVRKLRSLLLEAVLVDQES